MLPTPHNRGFVQSPPRCFSVNVACSSRRLFALAIGALLTASEITGIVFIHSSNNKLQTAALILVATPLLLTITTIIVSMCYIYRSAKAWPASTEELLPLQRNNNP